MMFFPFLFVSSVFVVVFLDFIYIYIYLFFLVTKLMSVSFLVENSNKMSHPKTLEKVLYVEWELALC